MPGLARSACSARAGLLGPNAAWRLRPAVEEADAGRSRKRSPRKEGAVSAIRRGGKAELNRVRRGEDGLWEWHHPPGPCRFVSRFADPQRGDHLADGVAARSLAADRPGEDLHQSEPRSAVAGQFGRRNLEGSDRRGLPGRVGLWIVQVSFSAFHFARPGEPRSSSEISLSPGVKKPVWRLPIMPLARCSATTAASSTAIDSPPHDRSDDPGRRRRCPAPLRRLRARPALSALRRGLARLDSARIRPDRVELAPPAVISDLGRGDSVSPLSGSQWRCRSRLVRCSCCGRE